MTCGAAADGWSELAVTDRRALEGSATSGTRRARSPCDNKRVQASAAAATGPSDRPRGSVAARRACAFLVSCWALAGAAFSARFFQSSWAHPVPVYNPATDGPMPDDIFDSGVGVMILAFVMAVPLAGLWVAATACGFDYLRGAALTRRFVNWACALAAAAVVSVAFLYVFLFPPALLFGKTIYPHPSWGLLGFSALFLITGVVLVAVIMVAAREAIRQAAEASGRVLGMAP